MAEVVGGGRDGVGLTTFFFILDDMEIPIFLQSGLKQLNLFIALPLLQSRVLQDLLVAVRLVKFEHVVGGFPVLLLHGKLELELVIHLGNLGGRVRRIRFQEIYSL